MPSFSISRLPHLLFGEGTLSSVVDILGDAKRIALITGGGSFDGSEYSRSVLSIIHGANINVERFSVSGEPSPRDVDVIRQSLTDVDAVVALGGGSVIDTGKALSAALHLDGSIKEYLEGVGSRVPDGKKTFFVAIPTTSGTGSEATKNAVLSEVGEGGFKKSLRHDNYVPDVAIIDPQLMVSCPPDVTAQTGMDAVTQLLEAYTSAKANPVTDALAESGLEAAGRSLVEAYQSGSSLQARADMAYAAYCSGVCLANAGLGVVHGIASPAGAMTSVPHGVVCGTLLAEATEHTVRKLRQILDQRGWHVEPGESGTAEGIALSKYGRAGELLSGRGFADVQAAADALIHVLRRFQETTELPSLGMFGLDPEKAHALAAASGLKNHPVDLSVDEIAKIIEARI